MLDPATDSHPTDSTLGLDISRPRPAMVVLEVRGEIDTVTAPRVEAALTEVQSGEDAALVVDLSRVTFLASSGLVVLIGAAHRAQARGSRIRLVAATRAVRRPLEITGSDQLFGMHASLTEATEAAAATD